MERPAFITPDTINYDRITPEPEPVQGMFITTAEGDIMYVFETKRGRMCIPLCLKWQDVIIDGEVVRVPKERSFTNFKIATDMRIAGLEEKITKVKSTVNNVLSSLHALKDRL